MKFLLLFLCPLLAFSQADSPYKVSFTNEKIKIDGVLDEAVWQNIEPMGEFWQYFPSDTLKAQHRTEVKMTYDNKYVYVSAKCYPPNKNFVILSYRRD
ncbi:MAG: hypothetical protein ACK41O_25220 [Runella zeae]